MTEANPDPTPAYPEPHPWDDRYKAVETMPGKGTNWLSALRELCEHADNNRPSLDQLVDWWQEKYQIKRESLRMGLLFLVRAGLLLREPDGCEPSKITRYWLETGEPDVIVAQMHSTIRFIGEALDALKEPKTLGELKKFANERFGFGYRADNQMGRRLTWLNFAGMIKQNDGGQWEITSAGAALLDRLELHPPNDTRIDDSGATPSGPMASVDPSLSGPAAELIEELLEASINAKNPTRFEKAVRDCFDFLGFTSVHLGGPGQTDVLLRAALGRDSTYMVTVDAKTTATGHLGDGQIDWETLKEHRFKHGSEYSLVVGPDPSGKRLEERSHKNNVVVMSADDLAALCEQHSRLPLGLHTYRLLFASPGFVDTGNVDEAAKEQLRLGRVLELTLRRVRSLSKVHGAASAQDILISLTHANDLGVLEDSGVSREDIESALEFLASPLVRSIEELEPHDGGGTPYAQQRYFPSASNAVARQQLDLVARFVDPPDEDAETEAG